MGDRELMEPALRAIDELLGRLPDQGDPSRPYIEELIYDAMEDAEVVRYRGWSRRPIVTACPAPGRESEARRWVEGLGKKWPRRRVQRELGRMVEQLFREGRGTPGFLEIQVLQRIRRARPTTRAWWW